MLGKQHLILIFGILAFFVFAGCVEVGKAQVDAISVWQHQSDSDSGWDIWYSLWDHTGKKWHVPAGGEAAPIATDTGNDHDPDVSSTIDTAVAVWSKEEVGKRTIYFSRWSNYVWTTPATVSSGGKDTDPTVAMSYYGDAMAVWVHDGKELYYSLYSGTIGQWTTPKKIDTTGMDTVSLPEVTYSEYWGTYFLIFTGLENGTQYAYEMFYWGTWQGPWWIDYDAVIDNNQPTDQRTGISGDRNSGYVTYVWPVTDGTLESYSYMYDFTTYTFNLYGTKMMPDTAYDDKDVAHGVQTKNNDLYHQPNVNSPTTENLIYGAATNDYRGALTFILDRTVGLVVWWNKEDGTGEIYSSYYENGAWQGVRPIVTNYLTGYDRNPAVTPLQAILFYYEEPPYCGDGVLQDPPEECEVGIPCKNPNEICWIDCLCYDFEYPYCGDGILDPGEQCEVGIPCPNPNDLCWWDCKCYSWPPPRTPPEPPEDEPKEPEEPEEPPEENETAAVSCKANTGSVDAAGYNNYSSTMQCSDDCGEGYICDAASCYCLPSGPVITPRCGDGYISTPNVPGGGTEECDTGSATSPKPDTCPYPEICINCKCIGIEEAVSCTGNTLEVDRLDLNKFHSQTMTCTDDCSLLYGENYECNAGSCTCTPKRAPEDEEEEEDGTCTDDSDCSEGYICCPDTHVCVYQGPEALCGDGILTPPEQCEVGIDCPEGYECDDCMCYYYEIVQECGDGVREGTEECDGTDMGDCSEDDVCSEGCTCVSPPSLDCKVICGEMNLLTILGHGYETVEDCQEAASEGEEPCYTKCILAGFYRVDNIAGWDSCCCKKKEMFPCTDECTKCPECPEEYQD